MNNYHYEVTYIRTETFTSRQTVSFTADKPMTVDELEQQTRQLCSDDNWKQDPESFRAGTVELDEVLLANPSKSGSAPSNLSNLLYEEQQGTIKDYSILPEPTPEMLEGTDVTAGGTFEAVLFSTVWEVIKTWDIAVPGAYEGYTGAMGNHAAAICYPILNLIDEVLEGLALERRE